MKKIVDSIIKNKVSLLKLESNKLASPVGDKSISGVRDSKKRFFLKTVGAVGIGALIYSLFSKKAQALVFGSAPATNVVGLKDSSNTRISPAKEEDTFPTGSSSDGTIALASADTWYTVPSSAPTTDYTIIVSLENADGTVRWSFNNGGTPSATNGNLVPNHIALNIGANKSVYFGSSTAGDDVNFTVIEKE